MIRNISYKDRELNELIDSTVGSSYGLVKALRLKGIGSPRMQITEGSQGFVPFLTKIGKGEFCNIELRPQGIIVRFRYNLDSMAWIIPFYKLNIFKSGDHFSLHAEGEFLKVMGANEDVQLDKFFRKLQKHKAVSLSA